MKIDHQLDELMWRLAETADPEAMDVFAVRHPEHKAELAKRIQMVRSLKGSRPSKSRPAFFPKRVAGPLPAPRWVGVLAFSIILVAVAFATFAVVKFTENRQEPILSRMPEHREPTAPIPANPGSVTKQPPQSGEALTGSGVPPKAPTSNFDRPVTVVADRINLSQALDEIAKQADVVLTPAPGMPDLEIRIDYQESAAILVLQDLGRNFGFTALIQNDRVALLIPARDRSKSAPQFPKPLPGGSSSPVSGPVGTGEGSTGLPPVP